MIKVRKSILKHKHLREVLYEVMTLGDDAPLEAYVRLFEEFKHSSLIIAGNFGEDLMDMSTVKTEIGVFGMLFTDMDEFNKVFPDYGVGSKEHFFTTYVDFLKKTDLSGYILNFKSEGFIMPRDLMDSFKDLPDFNFPTDDAYNSKELKNLKDSINNEKLESFIKDPKNIAKYDELFEEMSSSTLLTLMLSKDDLSDNAEDGIISSSKDNPVGFLYIDHLGGEYATVYTSEEKMTAINTPFKKYSQIVNPAHMVMFVLNEDMDGLIINPGNEQILLTRETLLDYSEVIEKTCNNPKLNKAMLCMFLMEV